MNQLFIERINQGQPLLSPVGSGWESGGVINPAAVFLPPSTENLPILNGLLPDWQTESPDGLVALVYRAFPAAGSAEILPASRLGLALFTPDLRLLRRSPAPLLEPDPSREAFDFLGVEDPRITRIHGRFYLLYCGVRLDSQRPYRTRLCLAESDDLLHWRKHGPIPGGPDAWDNKDGVIFPEPIDGRFYLLHRPWGQDLPDPRYAIWLASAESPLGPWQDHGPILSAFENPAWHSGWVGGGSVPIPLGGARWMVLYHTGAYLTPNHRQYDLAAALLDFEHFDPNHPAGVMRARLEPLLSPQTSWECGLTADNQRLDVIFPCASYIYNGHIYILYGAGDTHVAAARAPFAPLCAALERASLQNPYLPR